jgi:hypothetical protein
LKKRLALKKAEEINQEVKVNMLSKIEENIIIQGSIIAPSHKSRPSYD